MSLPDLRICMNVPPATSMSAASALFSPSRNIGVVRSATSCRPLRAGHATVLAGSDAGIAPPRRQQPSAWRSLVYCRKSRCKLPRRLRHAQLVCGAFHLRSVVANNFDTHETAYYMIEKGSAASQPALARNYTATSSSSPRARAVRARWAHTTTATATAASSIGAACCIVTTRRACLELDGRMLAAALRPCTCMLIAHAALLGVRLLPVEQAKVVD